MSLFLYLDKQTQPTIYKWTRITMEAALGGTGDNGTAAAGTGNIVNSLPV